MIILELNSKAWNNIFKELIMIPLKVITEYSLLKSLIKIPDLIKHLTSHNINVCGICDDELFGLMEF